MKNYLLVCSLLKKSNNFPLYILKRFNSNVPNPKPPRKSIFSIFQKWFEYIFRDNSLFLYRKDSILWTHKYDRLDPQKWVLIYRDMYATRIFLLIQCFILYIPIFVAYVSYDYTMHKKITNKLLLKRIEDIEAAGPFGYAFILVFLVWTLLLLNYTRMPILRIYKQIDKPTFKIVAPTRLAWGQTIRTADLNEIERQPHFYDSQEIDAMELHITTAKKLINLYVFGNILVQKRRYVLGEDSHFKDPAFKTYFLNEYDEMNKDLKILHEKRIKELEQISAKNLRE